MASQKKSPAWNFLVGGLSGMFATCCVGKPVTAARSNQWT